MPMEMEDLKNCDVTFESNYNITDNTATSGGAVYAHKSTLEFENGHYFISFIRLKRMVELSLYSSQLFTYTTAVHWIKQDYCLIITLSPQQMARVELFLLMMVYVKRTT